MYFCQFLVAIISLSRFLITPYFVPIIRTPIKFSQSEFTRSTKRNDTLYTNVSKICSDNREFEDQGIEITRVWMRGSSTALKFLKEI